VRAFLELLCLDLQIKLKRALAFRRNFWLRSSIALFHSFIFSTFQLLLYAGVHGYPGWSPEQMLLFQATLILWTGSVDLLFGGLAELIDVEVVYGNFDRFFLWPRSTLVSLLSRGTNIYALGTVLAGLVGSVALLLRLGPGLSVAGLLLCALFFVSGVWFYAALLVVYSGLTLFLVKMARLREVLERIVFFGSFPSDAYFGPGKSAVLTVLPIALWAYWPTQALLGRARLLACESLALAAVCSIAAVAFWRRQECAYTSAGG
jgi:ABC-2 type transport system permease protein